MRRFSFVLSLSGLCLFSVTPGAVAASFDCNKASKPVERAICADKSLSAADEQLAQDYTRLLAAVPASVKPSVQKSQRSWLNYLPMTCSSDGRGNIKDQSQFTQCLKTEYEQRIANLVKQPQKIGSYQFVTSAEFQAMPSSSTDPEFFPIVTHTKSVSIVFGENVQQAQQLNMWLQSLASSNQAGWDDPEISMSFDVTFSKLSPLLASATLVTDMFGVGAAHPVATISMRHLILATGKPLTYRDLLQSNARSNLTTLVWTQLKKKLGQDLMLEKKSDLAKMIDDPARWSFAAEGLIFNFNVYEVAAYVMGPQDVTVAWPALRAMLTPMGQAIADAAQ